MSGTAPRTFALMDLEPWDRLNLRGDGFDAPFVVIKSGVTPVCLIYGEDDQAPRVVQLVGHLRYADEEEFVDVMSAGQLIAGGSGRVLFVEVGVGTAYSESLTSFDVHRGDDKIFEG